VVAIVVAVTLRCRGHRCPVILVAVVVVVMPSLSQLLSWPLLALLQPSWSCHCCRIRSGACVVIVAIAVVVGEALPAANTALFPTEGAAGLASNSQVWLREPQLQSLRHCSPGQRQRQNADPRCLPREGLTKNARRHAWLPRGDPDRGHECAGMPGCCKSAHWRTRAGQSRSCKRRVAVVAIEVAVGCGGGRVVVAVVAVAAAAAKGKKKKKGGGLPFVGL